MGQRGQVSIMLGMMLLTFILFFTFVINTGMLVNAKINLQNGADLAAYAGAAVQARQLNQISYLNYEMRRQYKKLLYRYYVLGNMAIKSFPQGGGGDKSAMRWSPDNQLDYTVPATCIIFNSKDNYCQMGDIPKIPKITKTPLDSINNTLGAITDEIERARQDSCIAIGITNQLLNAAWMTNTDPDHKQLLQSLPAKLSNVIKNVGALGHGLGLVPRELLLRNRIDTLATYVNAPVQVGLNFDKAQSLMQTADPAKYERSVQAMLSAYYTLGPHIFEDSASVVMDELLPSANGNANLLALEEIAAKFKIYGMDFDVGGQASGKDHKDCKPKILAYDLGAPIPLGVKKKTDIMTYYAIRLKAKARIMFSPFGDMELKAYAAAQPFGSRIGPQIDAQAFLRSGVEIPGIYDVANTPLTGLEGNSIPNLPIDKDDGSGQGQGWDRRGVIGELGTKLGISPTDAVDLPAMERGYQVGMAPNPWEVGRYNIMNDLGNDPFVKNFDSTHLAAIWAPVAPLDKLANFRNDLKKKIDDALADLPGQSSSGQTSDQLKDAMLTGLLAYLDKMNNGQGEDNEGFKIVRIRDPYITRDEPARLIASSLMEADPKKVKSSWNNHNDSNFYEEGRVGYSVKFVSFDSLTSHRNPTDEKTSWTNFPDAGAEGASEIQLIRH